VSETGLPEAVCGACGAQGGVVRFERREQENVRGLKVEVTKTLRRCTACGEEFENSRDPDWRMGAYAQFRAAKGWITPEQIIEWRRRHDLSQEDVGRLLGWGEVTLGRYERGALQTESHNAQLAQLMAEGGVARALAERPDALPAAKKGALRVKLEAEYGIPTVEEIRRFRKSRGQTPGEAGLDVFVSADTWAAWEAGVTFPDARAGRLIRLMMADGAVVDQLRVHAAATGIAVRTDGVAGPRRAGRAPRPSPEAAAFWASAKELGFLPAKLRPLFPGWVAGAEVQRTASMELGGFAQLNMGFAADFGGTARLLSPALAHLKATKHQGNPAHAAAVAMSVAAARLVARATTTEWMAPLPSAIAVRATILRSTNRGWVDFANLASFLWDRGIPVIHLPKLPVRAKGMDGLVTYVEGRPVIVLNKDQALSDWMLFVLAHEGGHVGRGHLLDEDGAAVVDDEISDVVPVHGGVGDEESEANEYAQEVLVDGGGLLAIQDRIPTAEQLAADAIEFGRQHRISPGHVVLNAIRHTPNPPFNLMPLAMKTLKVIDGRLGTPTTAEVCCSLAEGHLDLSRLRPESAEYLQRLGIL
jgi:putative zinc finger/helix-turn-helix YgiT family protein